jgi:hypothetical protein
MQACLLVMARPCSWLPQSGVDQSSKWNPYRWCSHKQTYAHSSLFRTMNDKRRGFAATCINSTIIRLNLLRHQEEYSIVSTWASQQTFQNNTAKVQGIIQMNALFYQVASTSILAGSKWSSRTKNNVHSHFFNQRKERLKENNSEKSLHFDTCNLRGMKYRITLKRAR